MKSKTVKEKYIEQIVDKILDMTPEQLEQMKHFFGIQNIDLESIKTNRDGTETASVFFNTATSRVSTDI